jgi:hypothetical protein
MKNKSISPRYQDAIIAFLSALALRGRTAIPPGDGAAMAHIADAAAAPRVASFPADAFRQALRRGWIACAENSDRHTITPAGRDALRRWRSGLVATRAGAGASPSNTDTSRPLQNPAESPLAWLASRRDTSGKPLLNPWELDAGERLRADLTFARLTPRVTMSWSGIPMAGSGRAATGPHDITDSAMAARDRVTAALRAVGPEFADILIDVCGHLRGLEDIARAEGWPRRAARLLLQKALSALARHYGIAPGASIEETIARRLRHWGAEDYRPSLAVPTGEKPQPD